MKENVRNSTSLDFLEEIFRSQEDVIRERLQEHSECTVCMKPYKVGSEVKMLPGCGHTFHTRCIDTWLRQKGICPIDRENVQKNLQRELYPNGTSHHDY